jgi:hypothetical protein
VIGLILPLIFVFIALWIILGAKRGKFSDNAATIGNLVVGVVVVGGGAVLLVFLPQIADFILGAAEPAAKPVKPSLAPIGTPGYQFDPVTIVGNWISAALPWVLGAWFTFFFLRMAYVLGKPLLRYLVPKVRAWMVRVARRRAFVEQHTGPEAMATYERLAARWGHRPPEVARCVECDRNEWPACRCALMREGYPMTSEPPAPEAPLGQFVLPAWGTADGRPLTPLTEGPRRLYLPFRWPGRLRGNDVREH